MDLKSIGVSPRRFESCRLRFVSKFKHFFTAIYNNYDRQLLSLAICSTCPGTGSLIVFFNAALCSLYFCASLFAFSPLRILGPGYFEYFLVEENPATVVVLLTAYHLYKADNSPGRFFNIFIKDSSFVSFKSNGKSLYVIKQQFGQVWWKNTAPFL